MGKLPHRWSGLLICSFAVGITQYILLRISVGRLIATIGIAAITYYLIVGWQLRRLGLAANATFDEFREAKRRSRQVSDPP